MFLLETSQSDVRATYDPHIPNYYKKKVIVIH